jgi:hypothetical protein
MHDAYIQLNPDSTKLILKLTSSYSNYLKVLHNYLETAFKRADGLLEEMVGRHTTKIEQTEMVLHEASRAYNHVNQLFRRPITSSKSLMPLIDALEKNLEQIETDIKQRNECPENDEPLAEMNRITSALARVGSYGKDGSSPKRRLSPRAASS